MTRLTLDRVERMADDALRRAGASEDQARPVARATRRAEADGISSVGLGYLPTYLSHLRTGRVAGRAQPVLAARGRPAAVSVDAAAGFAHPAFDLGLPELIAAAHRSGVGALAITRSYSIGVLGHPAEDIAMQGLVALAFANSPPNMAPWGGHTKVFGTNPLALAVPRKGKAPLVVDQASTVVTKVRLAAAAATGSPVPASWAFDKDGRPTTDPVAAMSGSMAPSGGAKGVNIALLVEILAACLTGANLSADIRPYARDDGPPPGAGQFFLAIDPDAFAAGFAERIERLAELVLADGGTRLPGDRRLASRAMAERDGVIVDETLLQRIEA